VTLHASTYRTTSDDTRTIARVYRARALDPLIDLAAAVADLLDREPGALGPSTDLARALAPFATPPGTQSTWPNATQRDLTSMLVLNRFYRSTGVYQGFAGLRLAAIHAHEAAGGPDAAAARGAFAEAAAALLSQAASRVGPQAPDAPTTHPAMLDRAVALLTSPAVAEHLGVDVPVDAEDSLLDPALGRLCAALSTAIGVDEPLTASGVELLQQVAASGTAALELVMDTVEDDNHLDAAIGHARAWAEALRALLDTVDVPRAWADPNYRRGLSLLERDVLPAHPAGQIDLGGAVRTADPRHGEADLHFSTETVSGEICCSTGDLYCGGNTNGDCTLSDDCPTLTLAWT
jgi:mersacidin/lichenicidin family type 2 lantibiotic